MRNTMSCEPVWVKLVKYGERRPGLLVTLRRQHCKNIPLFLPTMMPLSKSRDSSTVWHSNTKSRPRLRARAWWSPYQCQHKETPSRSRQLKASLLSMSTNSTSGLRMYLKPSSMPHSRNKVRFQRQSSGTSSSALWCALASRQRSCRAQHGSSYLWTSRWYHGLSTFMSRILIAIFPIAWQDYSRRLEGAYGWSARTFKLA